MTCLVLHGWILETLSRPGFRDYTVPLFYSNWHASIQGSNKWTADDYM
jgi:hypothetical protein